MCRLLQPVKPATAGGARVLWMSFYARPHCPSTSRTSTSRAGERPLEIGGLEARRPYLQGVARGLRGLALGPQGRPATVPRFEFHPPHPPPLPPPFPARP